MKITTRSRYGVRLMLELARNFEKGQVLLKDIARNEEISEKYLSLIIIPLRTAGLVQSTRGAHGGYSLTRPPEEITLKDIVQVLEGGISLVDCVENSSSCSRSQTCVSRDVWSIVSERISQTLESISLGDLLAKTREKADSAPVYYI
ncbi:MAG: RrF2 family transcriptional regulator [Desulfomonilia bacterium]|jgi:Rrf2 family protein|uniref:Protein rrf2 n=1 Tax=anaerobic digester metagenome TaxID=1263854 RepID=A0A485LU17_9ZZZZ|nr:Rrf2 family transcriptional regulator [Deltaproteobacteria bacterium]HRS57185.1 Rrf2 family transcriptional regulator [Desulfomonilia bacterium]HRV35836.1 Rrf2 family transcriptional regulator [Desulfomonilia bacterium]